MNFRDEKYLPFEGAGAVSEWQLDLPANFKPFDYQSISDVILSISYTAEDDEVLRGKVEDKSATLEGTLSNYLSNNSLTRVFSLRREFSGAFNRLIEAAAGNPTTIEITDRHFPLFLQGRQLNVDRARVVLAIADDTSVGSFSMSVNGTAVTGFSKPAKALAGSALGALKGQHTIVVNDAGDLGAVDGTGSSHLDRSKLRDIMLSIDYKL